MHRVLVTCPPMLGLLDEFTEYAAQKGLELVPAEVSQTLTEAELGEELPHFDGWIIGDDPATYTVFKAGRDGRLKAAVKWGVGTDNVDFEACHQLGIPVDNTPMMFGAEVADVAVGYVIGLARQLFYIDREIRERQSWPKPAGISLAGKKAGVVGLGDIGSNVAKRLSACDMEVIAYDPGVPGEGGVPGISRAEWPERVDELDFLVFTCALTQSNRHMLNGSVLSKAKRGVRIVNVARGQLIDQAALTSALKEGQVGGAALDVFAEEPLPGDSALLHLPQCVFGSHNSSNTVDAVRRASQAAIDRISGFL